MFDFTKRNQIRFAPDDGAGAGPTTDQNSQNAETASTSDVLSVLSHDPFPGGEAPKDKAGSKDTTAKAGGKTGTKAAPGTGAKGSTPDGSGDAQPGTTAPAADPEKDVLKQSLTHATELLDAYKQRWTTTDAGTKPAAAGKPAAPAQSDEPNYDFNIPDQLVQALTNEDPAVFKQGVAGFAKGIGLGVHKQVTTYIEKTIPQMLEKALPALINQHMQGYNSRKAIFDDFYGTYKELNNPKLYPLIGQITQEVQTELKTTQWTPAVRDTVAKRVKDFIQSIGGAVPKTETKLPPQKHPQLGGGNNSRGTVETKDKLEEEIADTLFGGF